MEILFWIFWIILIIAIVVFVIWYLKSRKKENNLPMKTEGAEKQPENEQAMTSPPATEAEQETEKQSFQ